MKGPKNKNTLCQVITTTNEKQTLLPSSNAGAMEQERAAAKKSPEFLQSREVFVSLLIFSKPKELNLPYFKITTLTQFLATRGVKFPPSWTKSSKLEKKSSEINFFSKRRSKKKILAKIGFGGSRVLRLALRVVISLLGISLASVPSLAATSLDSTLSASTVSVSFLRQPPAP